MALNVANVTVSGLNINSATAAVTGAVVITGAGVNIIGNFFSFTGALAGNSPIQVTGAANCVIAGNNFVVDSTATIVSITLAASTNFMVQGNLFRQAQATSGGAYVTCANTAGVTGMMANNFGKPTGASPAASKGFVCLPATAVGNFENYAGTSTAVAGTLADGT
jgi:hypothetical protein